MQKLQPTRTVDLAADTLRRAILAGDPAPGARLPPERALAESLGISRLTLRSALSHLEAEGLVQARQGSGITVLDWRKNAGVEILPRLIASGRLDLMEPFLVLRRAVAAEAVALVAEHASDADLDQLQRLADELAEASEERLREGNLQFASAVVDLADNVPMTLLYNTVSKVFAQRPEVSAALVADHVSVRSSFGLIVALLRSRDPDMARNAVREALTAIDARTLALLEDA